MSTARFQRGSNVAVAEVVSEREWRLPASGTAGMARITLRRDCAAASATYIDPDGGSQVTLLSDGGCGDWHGIITRVVFAGGTVVLTAYQPWVLLSRRIVGRQGTVYNVTPGYIATLAMRDMLAGVPGVQIDSDPYECGGPDIDFDFSGQDGWGILTDLMTRSDGEIHIDNDTGDAAWTGPLAYVTRYDTLLIAGGNLRDASYSADVMNRAAEVTAVNGTTRYTARRGDAAVSGWSAQVAVTAASALTMATDANAELDRRADSVIVIEGGVGPDQWDIRERMHVRVIDDQAGFTGRTHTCRVLARRVADGSNLMRLTLQVINPVVGTAVTAGAGARSRPLGRTAGDATPPIGTPDAATVTQYIRAMGRELTYLKRNQAGSA